MRAEHVRRDRRAITRAGGPVGDAGRQYVKKHIAAGKRHCSHVETAQQHGEAMVRVALVLVGFSAGTGEGFWAIFVYFFVQNVDGYLVVPYIARRTVDLAPALVLAAQLLFGALFGILGLLLADPILASIKVTLQKLSEGERPELEPAAVKPKAAPRRRKKP